MSKHIHYSDKCINRITKEELTPRQEVIRRNKVMRRGTITDTITGRYACGGSVLKGVHPNTIRAWGRK